MPLPLRWLREGWRRTIWMRGIDQRFDWRVLYLYAGIFAAPYLFVWFLLRRGHSMTERVIGFGYLAAILLMGVLANAPPRASPTVSSPPFAAVVAPPHYEDFAADLGPVLTGATSGTVELAALRTRNPALWRSLRAQWQAAVAVERAFPVYQEQAAHALNAVLGEALKRGDDTLLTDFATAYNSRLRWAERGSPDDCVDMLAGRSSGPSLTAFADYHHRLVGRAILAGTSPPGPARRGGKRLFTIPPAIFDEGQHRSLLDKAAFQQGLRDRGTALARCNAHIALIDAAVLSGSPAGRAILRGIFSPN